MNVTMLCGGVGGARCALAIDIWRDATGVPLELTTIVNVGDDFMHLGLHISPDIDSVSYHLGKLGDKRRGWGRDGDTQRIADQVAQQLPDSAWFHLGDLDLAHSLIRSELLSRGMTLSDVTAKFAADYEIPATILPVTDGLSPTLVEVAHERRLGFQEWWVRNQATPTPKQFLFPRAAETRPAPGVLESIRDADVVIIAPSNPIVSIAPIISIPGMRDALQKTLAPIVGLSPIIGGKPVRGWADRCLAASGIECSAGGVRDYYGSRTNGGLLDAWLVDPVDEPENVSSELRTGAAPLLFSGNSDDVGIVEAIWEMAFALQ